MSILDIVRYHGHNVIPVAAPDGRMTFVPAGSAAAAAGLAVKPHTFHGGADPDMLEGVPWWRTPGALDRDRAAVAQHFPGFVEIYDEESPPAWVGTIDSGAGKFIIAIAHRTDHGLPTVIPLSPKHRTVTNGRGVRRSEHLYDSGNLCVADQADWDPSEDTIATVISWAAHWHAAYVAWRATRRWPSEGFVSNAA